MIFHPKEIRETGGCFVLPRHTVAVAHAALSASVIGEFWHNFACELSTLEVTGTETLTFSVGDVAPLPLAGHDYSIRIEPRGICLAAREERALLHGFMALLDRFHAAFHGDESVIELACCEIRDSASLANRMVHFCIFPETELWELWRFLRFCAALRYTHVVLEFWGMLQYDCMRELAWSHGYTKEQLRPILDEARALGLEIIPMFNHWGHASAGRVMHGKHVVLDQAPSLQPYFGEDGWCWDIREPKVRALLRRVRAELIELCGKGEYFHIGCDEAYNFDLTSEASVSVLCDYINEVAGELARYGRKTIVWGDMLLCRRAQYNPKNRYVCNSPSFESERFMLDRLNKALIIADWQYWAVEAPVETTNVFKRAGFSCMLCPWDVSYENHDACLATIKEDGLFGVMHTTWHTLSAGMYYVLAVGVKSYETERELVRREARTQAAALLRRVLPANGVYERAGFSPRQIDFKW